jgi:type IV pilus secretin PilQ/predicted competence protein
MNTQSVIVGAVRNGHRATARRWVLALAALTVITAEVSAQKPAANSTDKGAVSIRDLTASPQNRDLVVTILTDGRVSHKEFLLEEPPRLAIDFQNAESRVPFDRLPVKGALVKRLRISQFQSDPTKVVRLVCDLSEAAQYSVIDADSSVMVLFRNVVKDGYLQPGSQATKTTAAAESKSAAPDPKGVKTSPAPEKAQAAKTGATESKSISGATPAATPVAPKANRPDPKPELSPGGADPLPKNHQVDKTHAGGLKPADTPASKPANLPSTGPAPLPPSSHADKAPQASGPPKSVGPEAKGKPAPAVGAAAPPVRQAPDAAPIVSKAVRPVKKPDPSIPAREFSTAESQPEIESKVTASDTPPQTKTTPAPRSAPAVRAPQPAAPIARDLARTDVPAGSETKPAGAGPAAAEPPVVPTETVKALPALPEDSSAAAGRFLGQPLTLDLVEIPLVDFFRLMAEEGGINIVMDPEIKGSISIKVVKVPWDQIFDAALTNNNLEKQVEGNLVRIARKATLQDEARQQESLKKANMLAADLDTRVKRLNYAKAAALMEPLLDQKTARGTVVVDERTNALILTDLPASVDRMIQLVDQLDTPQPQVEIEARIVSATRDFARDIGVQFGFVQGNLDRVTVGGPNTFGTIGGTRPSATPTSTYAAGTTTGRGASEGKSTESAGVSTGYEANNAGNYNVNLPSLKPFGGVGISVGNIFDTFLLDAAITAGESKGLAKLISQPKVVAQNNSAATITQGLRFPVQVIANNTVTVQFMNAALTLVVTPQITYEGNLVLDLKIENNTPDFAKSVNGIPSIHTSESATRVLVSDGGTTVIGGILIENETTQEDRVPGLASLPIVGNVFKRSMTSHQTQEVLFFITPRIVK